MKPRLSERDFQRQITDLAELFGWTWCHFRPALTSTGWRTPVAGPMGVGFPDLVMVHPAKKRLLFIEVKADGGRLTVAQSAVLASLHAIEHYPTGHCDRDIRVEVWTPKDWAIIEATLTIERNSDAAA